MKRFLLAVITEADICSASFCMSLAQSIEAGSTSRIEIFPAFFPCHGNWSMAFNQALTFAWKENLDGFVCVSPRVSWQPESLFELLSTDKDAVGMPVATKNGFVVKLGEISRLQEDVKSSEIKVLGISLDFIFLSTYSLKKLCEASPTITYRNNEVKTILQSAELFNTCLDPADILAYRLKEQGIELWATVKHSAYKHDTTEYSNNFEQILKHHIANG